MCNCKNHTSIADCPGDNKVKTLIETIADNDEAWAAFRSLAEKDDIPAIISLAGEHGVDITEADWQAYMKWEQSTIPTPKAKSGELSEEDLETVAGGFVKYETSEECWLLASVWVDNNTRVKCQRVKCDAPSGGGNGIRYVCKCWGTYTCCDKNHLLSALDRNGKCKNQKGYIGGPPPAGSK